MGHQTTKRATRLRLSSLLPALFLLFSTSIGAREWIVWFSDEPSPSWAVTQLNNTFYKEALGAKGSGIAIRSLKVGLGIHEVLLDPTNVIDFSTWDQVSLTEPFDAVAWAEDLLRRLSGQRQSDIASYQWSLVCSVDEWLSTEGSPKLNRHPYLQLTRARGSQKLRAIKVMNQIAQRLGEAARVPEDAKSTVIADFWRKHVVRPSFLDVESVIFEERLGVIRMKPVDAEPIEAESSGTDWANSVENVYK